MRLEVQKWLVSTTQPRLPYVPIVGQAGDSSTLEWEVSIDEVLRVVDLATRSLVLSCTSQRNGG